MSAVSLYAKPPAQFGSKLAQTQELLRTACALYQPITQASSLGAEDMVITHLLHTLKLGSEVFILQTGKLHTETLALLATVQTTYGIDRIVRVYEPDAAKANAFETIHGPEAMYQSITLRKQCCDIRKMVPLDMALKGKKAWITGLRREQSNARAEVLAIEQHESRAKINPLVDWTNGDVWHYIATHHVPYNALHD
ncbi:MAG: phosphoadenylyl-sulfate reductase, partial [Burkholderiaceae bacterium]